MVSYTLGNRNPPKKILAFKETDFFYNSGNIKPPPPPPPEILYISENKIFLYFRKNFQSPQKQNFLYFSIKSYK